jgi:acyl-CoA synthetase (AMP-forming)/AMP-acid ligase II
VTITDELSRHAADRGDAPFLLTASRTWSYAEAARAVDGLGDALEARSISRCSFYLPDSAELVLLLIACAARGIDACVFSRAATLADVGALLRRFAFTVLVTDEPAAGADGVTTIPLATLDAGRPATPKAARDEARLLVLTTGTTGDPKGAVYRWSDLCAQVAPRRALVDTRWLLAYHLNHFAGLQMLVHVVMNAAALAIPPTADIGDALAAIDRCGVQYVSATPTFWRLLLAHLGSARRAPALKQITLGGEAASPDLLAALAGRFPGARLSQVFATTEAGSCLSVPDGELGFPSALLDRPADAAVQLAIADGQLFVRSRHGMRGYYGEPEVPDAAWRPTGDLVETRGSRVVIVGRVTEVINVGGVKVHPLPIEARVLAVPGVRFARVRAVSNPVTGQIVGVEIVAEPGADRDALEARVRAACADLARASQPRDIRFVESLETANRKIVRRPA